MDELEELSVTPPDPEPALPPLQSARRSVPSLPPRGSIAPKPRAVALSISFIALALALWLTGSRAGWFLPDPLAIARAQLADLDGGRWQAAYNLFSPRYRAQMPYETWHVMALSHARMFHARQLQLSEDQKWRGGAALDAHLLAESGVRYTARFTLIYAQGRWWIDDMQWGREQKPPGEVFT